MNLSLWSFLVCIHVCMQMHLYMNIQLASMIGSSSVYNCAFLDEGTSLARFTRQSNDQTCDQYIENTWWLLCFDQTHWIYIIGHLICSIFKNWNLSPCSMDSDYSERLTLLPWWLCLLNVDFGQNTAKLSKYWKLTKLVIFGQNSLFSGDPPPS